MASRKDASKANSKSSKVETSNGDDLRRALDWVVTPELFTNIKVHGNANWKVLDVVRVAVFWMWSREPCLVEAADDAIERVRRIFGQHAVRSYQTLTNALCRYTGEIFPMLRCRMQALMEKTDPSGYRIGIWLAIAMDGSRLDVPRTVKNEKRFCKAGKKTNRKKKKAKKRGRHATKAKPKTHKKTYYDPQAVGPQVWLTLIWHIGQRLPWSWKIGPSYSSERQHVIDMLDQKLPENTLFCGDAGFVGYEFWREFEKRGHSFLVRVGGNVRLLRGLGYRIRRTRGIVYSWPEEMMKKSHPPIVLRLIQLKTGRNEDVFLVTNVLNSRSLSDQLAGQIFRQRWGIEVQFRHLKQTYERSKLQSRTPDKAISELTWSLISLWMLQLLALKEQTSHREPEAQTSIAQVLKIVQRLLSRDTATEEPTKRLRPQLRNAVTDTYERHSKKQSRNYPRRKEEPAPKSPHIQVATKIHKNKIKQLKSHWATAA
jgi:hypothetical protein